MALNKLKLALPESLLKRCSGCRKVTLFNRFPSASSGQAAQRTKAKRNEKVLYGLKFIPSGTLKVYEREAIVRCWLVVDTCGFWICVGRTTGLITSSKKSYS